MELLIESIFEDYMHDINKSMAHITAEIIERNSEVFIKNPYCKLTKKEVQKIMILEICNFLKMRFNINAL